jgi:hypothetical protein
MLQINCLAVKTKKKCLKILNLTAEIEKIAATRPIWKFAATPVMNPLRMRYGPVMDTLWTRYGCVMDALWTRYGCVMDASITRQLRINYASITRHFTSFNEPMASLSKLQWSVALVRCIY